MKKIHTMLCLAGILVIAAIVTTPANAADTNPKLVAYTKMCAMLADYAAVVVEERDMGTDAQVLLNEALATQFPGAKEQDAARVRMAMGMLISAAYSNRKVTPAQARKSTYEPCLAQARNKF